MSAAQTGKAISSAPVAGMRAAGEMPLDPRDRGGPAQPLLTVEGLRKHFPVRGGLLNRQVATVQAVDDVSFSVRKGETLGIVGESGCGKSTTGLAVMRLLTPTAGAVRVAGQDVATLSSRALTAYRRRMQIVFQDPYSSLNPRQRVADIIRAPLDIHGLGTARERRAFVADLMGRVGLRPDQAKNFPHQFSGGQRQRIAVARALAPRPKVLVADEAVSALDVSVRAQTLNLMMDLTKRFDLTLVFVSHDLSVIRYLTQRVAVMQHGRIVELGNTEDVYADPQHPYTQELLAAVPQLRYRPASGATA